MERFNICSIIREALMKAAKSLCYMLAVLASVAASDLRAQPVAPIGAVDAQYDDQLDSALDPTFVIAKRAFDDMQRKGNAGLLQDLHRLARGGSASATRFLADHFSTTDESFAYSLYMEAANKGNVGATLKFAEWNKTGRGFKQSRASGMSIAAKYYEAAATLKSPTAYFELSRIWESGEERPKSRPVALAYCLAVAHLPKLPPSNKQLANACQLRLAAGMSDFARARQYEAAIAAGGPSALKRLFSSHQQQGRAEVDAAVKEAIGGLR